MEDESVKHFIDSRGWYFWDMEGGRDDGPEFITTVGLEMYFIEKSQCLIKINVFGNITIGSEKV